MPTPNQSKINLLVSKLKSIFASINHTHDYTSILVDENLEPVISKKDTQITIEYINRKYQGYLTELETNIPISNRTITFYGDWTSTLLTDQDGYWYFDSRLPIIGPSVVFEGDDEYNGCEATL